MTDYSQLTDAALNETAAKAMGKDVFVFAGQVNERMGKGFTRQFTPATDHNNAALLQAEALRRWPDHAWHIESANVKGGSVIYFAMFWGDGPDDRFDTFSAEHALQPRAVTVCFLMAWEALGAG